MTKNLVGGGLHLVAEHRDGFELAAFHDEIADSAAGPVERFVDAGGFGKRLLDPGVLDRLALQPLAEIAGSGVFVSHHQAARGHDGQHIGHEVVMVPAEALKLPQKFPWGW